MSTASLPSIRIPPHTRRNVGPSPEQPSVGVSMPALADRPPLAATTPRRPGRALCQIPHPAVLQPGRWGSAETAGTSSSCRAWRRLGRGVGERSPRRNGQRRRAESRASGFGAARSARTRCPSATTTEPVLRMVAIGPRRPFSLRQQAAPTLIPMPSIARDRGGGHPRRTAGPMSADPPPAGPCATLANQPHVARDKPAGARRQIPAFSAIGRDLVEHRVGEIAARARADEWGLRGQLGRRVHAGHGARAGARCAAMEGASTRIPPSPLHAGPCRPIRP